MDYEFINFRLNTATGRWERAGFLRKWWGIYGSDRYRAPLPYRQLRTALTPEHNPHLARTEHSHIYLEAFRRHKPKTDRSDPGSGFGMPPAIFEEPVSAFVLLIDPRQQERTAQLALFRAINNADVLDQLFFSLTEHLWRLGCRRIIGPVGLSPFLGSGVLQDHFHVTPPLHSAYNPPYFPDLLAGSMTLVQGMTMYHAETPPPDSRRTPAGMQIVTRPPADLAGSLLPLFQASCAAQTLFPPPDREETCYLLGSIGPFDPTLRVALQGDQAVGFALLCADHAELLRRTRGGRNPLRALDYAVRRRRGVEGGRLLFGGVAPSARGQGCGRGLWLDALDVARGRGWRRLAAGPVLSDSAGARFLMRNGAVPAQTYGIYSRDL